MHRTKSFYILIKIIKNKLHVKKNFTFSFDVKCKQTIDLIIQNCNKTILFVLSPFLNKITFVVLFHIILNQKRSVVGQNRINKQCILGTFDPCLDNSKFAE